MAGERWIFSREEIANSPSRKCGMDAEKELNYRQQTANMIQDMGQKLQVYPSPWYHHSRTTPSFLMVFPLQGVLNKLIMIVSSIIRFGTYWTLPILTREADYTWRPLFPVFHLPFVPPLALNWTVVSERGKFDCFIQKQPNFSLLRALVLFSFTASISCSVYCLFSIWLSFTIHALLSISSLRTPWKLGLNKN